MVRTLSTADARREALLEAALPLFAERGITGTPTLAVAKASGISQAYLFRLFPTKADLAVALIARTNDRIHEVMSAAGSAAKLTGDEVIPAMGKAYTTLLAEDRDLLLLQLHAHAASPEFPAIRDAMREGFARLFEMVRDLTAAPDDEIQRFFAHGMLCNVIAALDMPALDAPWAQALVGPGTC